MPARILSGGFHEGEVDMHKMMHVRLHGNPTAAGLPLPYGHRVQESPLVALGTLDDQGQPWTTIWGGTAGFARPVAQGILGMNSAVDTAHDPVFQALWKDAESVGGGQGGDNVVRPNGGEGKMMSALSLFPMTRDRVKLAGNMIAGADTGDDGVQMAMQVTESLGNCPKYLTKRHIATHDVTGSVAEDGLPLSQGALDVIAKADIFFMSTTDGYTMDTNNRGGAPGFMRVARNDDGGVSLVYPEFSGNRLYQSLGNLKVNPCIGIAIPDFDTSDVVYVTGTASILFAKDAAALIPRTNLAIKIDVSAGRYVRGGLPFRGSGSFVEYSPYMPPLRRLLAEQDSHLPSADGGRAEVTAHLVGREEITPSIKRFTFRLDAFGGQLPEWRAGQYMAIDFSPELDHGYSHMRDDDPQSLNDDFIRTFTISSPPNKDRNEVEITVRKHGPATGFLWRYHVGVPLELPVLGFGGDESFSILPIGNAASDLQQQKQPVFVAGGVGITPMLAQARAVLDAGCDLRLLWSLRVEDLALAADTFERIPGLAAATSLFVTGAEHAANEQEGLAGLRNAGSKILETRIGEDDLRELRGQGRKFFLCAGPGLLKMLRAWLGGEEMVWEDFNY